MKRKHKVAYTIIGVVGLIVAGTGIFALVVFPWDRPVYSLIWVIVGGFIVWRSIRKLSQKAPPKVKVRLVGYDGESRLIEFRNMDELTFWYRTNKNWEGITHVEVLRPQT